MGVKAQAPSTSAGVTTVFRRLVSERIRAESDADTAALRRLVDRALVYIDNDGSRRTADERASSIAAAGREEGVRHDVDSVHASRAGELAFVDYRATTSFTLGSRNVVLASRALDTFVLRDGRWRLLRHAETRILDVPAAVPLDSAVIAEYVGRYESWPGNVDTITRNGNQLSHQSTAEDRPIPIVAAASDAFHEIGNPILVVFTRGRSGAVNGYVMHFPDGQVVQARRLP
jgi:hypothetical protein